MQKNIVILFLLLIFISGFAQNTRYGEVAIPEFEAEFPGGHNQLTLYLTKNIINKISEKRNSEKLQQATVKFTVDEEGQIKDAIVYRTTTDQQLDELILDAINKMPKWKPAKNANGIKLKQEFIIPIGGGGGC